MKIKSKLFITYGALIALVFIIVGVNFQTYKALENDAAFINYSGRLRATTYRMSLLAGTIATNDQDDRLKVELEEAMDIFDTLVAGIKEGNKELGLTRLKHVSSREKIDDMTSTWENTFKPIFNQVLSSGHLESTLQLNDDVRAYTLTINEMVNGYSAYSHQKVVNAKLINGILSMIAFLVGLISFYFLNKGIRRPIGFLTEDLKALAEGSGDLTKRIETISKDEIADLTTYFNDFVGNIHDIVMNISSVSTVLSGNMNSIADTTEELTRSTELIAVSSSHVAEGSLLQNTQLDELNRLAERLQGDIVNVSKKAAETLRSSEYSQQSAEKGNRQVETQSKELNDFSLSIEEASHTVEDLHKSSEEIKAIVELIQNISSQTNLLALNASIEAARAGESGRGFAVVANEIRGLAEETALSATRISDIVGNLNRGTSNVRSSMDDLVGKTRLQEASMDGLRRELREILDRSTITLEESKSIMEISLAVSNDFNIITESVHSIQGVSTNNTNNTQEVASAVQEQTAAFEEVSANITSMDEMANKLNDIVNVFKI